MAMGFYLIQAQESNLHFINFSSKDGLPSSTVNAILKDRWGYMWFGTDDGLSRYDGSRFIAYNHNGADTSTLSSNNIMALYEDAQGNLWVGTDKGLSLYDRVHDAFRNTNATQGCSVRTICGDQNGNLWIGSYSGLYKYHHATGYSKYYSSKDGGNNQFASSMIISVFLDSQQRLWIGSNAGLYLYQPSVDDFVLFSGNTPDSSLIHRTIKVITEDHEGNLWVGTIDGGLKKLPYGGSSFQNYQSGSDRSGSLSSNRIYGIAQDNDGKLWIGTEKGLDILDPRSGEVEHVVTNARNKYSMKGNSIRSLYIDRKGIYWVGTFQNGVNKYDINLTAFNLVQSNPFDPFGLSSPKVTSFAEGPNGNIYVGTDGGGLNFYNRRSGMFNRIEVGRRPLTILAIEKVGVELWLATYQQGIYVLNTRNGKVRHFSREDGSSGLISNEIFCIRKDRYGNIWIGTNGMGVQVYLPGRGKFLQLSDYTAGAAGDKVQPKGFVRAIEEDKEGRIWMAVIGRGLDMYDPATNTLRMYRRDHSTFPIDEIQCVLAGKDGILWGGTAGRGLCRIDLKNNSFKVYSAHDGLASEVIWKILEDSSGILWLSTNKGISRLDPSKPAFKNFTHENGLQPSAFTLGAGLLTKNGEMFFGGLEGFNYFLPKALHYNRNIPSVVFTGLKVDNNPAEPGGKGPIRSDITMAREIKLDYGQNFSIDFTTLDFTSSYECQYRYKLEGFNNSWTYIGTSKTAVFTNLDPGKYTLLVKAYNPNGEWTTESAAITVYIKPPFWRTYYAYAFYLLLAASTLLAVRYRGIRRLKQKFAAEQERQQIRQLIEEERKAAERQRAFDEAKIKFLTNLSHEFRTPIALIAGPVQTLFDGETDQKKRDQLGMVKRNTRRLLNLVNQLLDFRKLEEQELRLNATAGDIIGFAKEVVESFRDLADRRHIRFCFHTSMENYYTVFDRDKIERVLFNLLSNAFKFTARHGEVVMCMKKDDSEGGIMISISDNGIGMTVGEQTRIFDRFFQGETHAGIMNQGSGIGLSITREFVRLHGGSISVNSFYGKGSEFTIRLPLAEQALSLQEAHGDELPGHEPLNGQADMQETAHKGRPCLRVLLIEDNEEYRNYLKDNLRSSYKIIEAVDGREGWQKALSGHPHVIVSDISMPHIDGITLSKKIRADKRTAHIPIILLTALTGDAYQLKGLQTGASDYLTKPFSADILKVKIQNLALLNQSLKETYSRRLEVSTSPSAVESEHERLLLKITSYIEENIDDDKLSVEQLAKHLFMSRATLYNKVMDMTGETPVEFIRSIRLNKAAELLEKSDLRIGEIGYSVGFLTPNYFTRAFKAKFNMSPSEYVGLKKKPAS